LEDFLKVCEKHFLPVIADEIYENMAFETGAFHPLGDVSTEVPILTTGGLAKQYMAPGWRIGWILIHDRHDRFKQVRVGLDQLATLILGPNSLLQHCTATCIKDTPPEYYAGILKQLKYNAEYCLKRAAAIPGLHPITPQGAMYMLTRIDVEKMDVEDDVDFCKKMLAEESVGLLPGSCFGADNFFRVVVCPPEDKLCVAWDRIEEFCSRHTVN
jgi:tyrosine aminotransferase